MFKGNLRITMNSKNKQTSFELKKVIKLWKKSRTVRVVEKITNNIPINNYKIKGNLLIKSKIGRAKSSN